VQCVVRDEIQEAVRRKNTPSQVLEIPLNLGSNHLDLERSNRDNRKLGPGKLRNNLRISRQFSPAYERQVENC